jgi:hypothetical protein
MNKETHHSEETRRKISKACMGRIPWNKGLKNFRKYSSEECLKISERMTGARNPMYGRFGENHPAYGNKHSSETKKKISLTHRGKLKSEEHKKKMCKFPRGEKHPYWKGGITPEYRRIIGLSEFRKWRKQVFEKDNYTCQRCLSHDGNLCAHHIIPFFDAKEEGFNPDNGATLCRSCHTWIHKREYKD